MIKQLTEEAIELLQKLISKQSFSGEENETALLIMQWFSDHNIKFESEVHNVWAKNKYFDPSKKTILLNSHHDTVKPNKGYTRDPLLPEIIDGKLYGLGSNDAGGCLVSLLATFTYLYDRKDLKYNFVMVASAEEENTGPNSLVSIIPILPKIDFAIVGEPTLMNLAISEKGLMVLNCEAKGTSGHAAHGNADNAIYNAIKDINWFQTYEFPKISETLGNVRMTVTQIEAGSQHNVIPSSCKFVVDVRVTDCYSNQEVFEIIQENVRAEVCPRSQRLNSSSIPKEHEIVKAGIKLGRTTYGSPTISDQAILTCPSLKLGPGESLRSHTADEFIYIREIEEGIDLYIKILEKMI
ncbi:MULTISPECIES: M20 family metallo-hydrolase [Flavobacteriaceae]|uniref:M20/M25/M40 family metallo-hydrolase n=2 Tax=Flavobacteriaceae TaxID=49546 RepID=A0A4Y8AT05_9FLAO|nr:MULTISPECIES: M20 family metallo-hydrolase [Flavobacteriaceae]TEW75004.1 M20/M25/M40 family metallo-hydrolase [Gramella jeungdoensis]GGK42366.1 acetylornithine deacetylase [Lutibacter litoralis]